MKKFMVIFIVFIGVSCSHYQGKYSGQVELKNGRIIRLQNATIMNYERELYISDGECDSTIMTRDIKKINIEAKARCIEPQNHLPQ